MNGSRTKSFRCWAEIDLAALERNLFRIRSALPEHIRYVAVVKADAYGHGLPQAVSRLMQAEADMFAVANPDEARAVREIGTGWPILILGPLLPGEEDILAEEHVIGTVSSRGELDRLERASRETGRIFQVHLKVDTGMGRLGVWHEEAGPLIDRLRVSERVELRGIYTHFSDAASPGGEHTRIQRQRFLHVLETGFGAGELDRLLIHADNSASLETFERTTPFNAVRVGLLQFGVTQYQDSILDTARVEPVFSFHTRIGLVKTLPAGTPISYARTLVLPKETRVAVLTGGYGDGIPTAASNRGSVLIRGRRCPILGRVTMDQTIVDVSGLDEVAPGERATIIGRQEDAAVSVSEFSEHSGTIPWEAFCTVTKRVPRIYLTRRE